MKFTVSLELNLPDRRRLTKKQKAEIMYFIQGRVMQQAIDIPECVHISSTITTYIIEKDVKKYLNVENK